MVCQMHTIGTKRASTKPSHSKSDPSNFEADFQMRIRLTPSINAESQLPLTFDLSHDMNGWLQFAAPF